MRLTVALFLLAAGVAQAQTPLTGTTGPLTAAPPRASATPIGRSTEQVAPPATPTTATPTTATPTTAATRRTGRTLQERFDEANTTHDGHLTLEQARAKMPSVARDFTAMDTEKKGYVTEEQIRDYRREKRAATRAAKKAAAAAAPASATPAAKPK